MEKEITITKRSAEEVIASFFPNINREKLQEILKDNPLSPLKKRKTINDEAFIKSEKKFANTTFYLETEKEKLDEMFAAKESNYKRAVKKSVTTKQLANPLKKKFEMPIFLKNNIRKIYALTGNYGTYSSNRIRLSALKKENIIFSLHITGSDDTEYAFRLLARNFSFISEMHKSVFVYIIPTAENEMTYNFKNKKDNIINKFQVEMRNLDVDKFFFATEPEKPKELLNTITQYYKFCTLFPFSYSFFGYSGLKGPFGDKKELERNLRFLMKYHKQPYVVIKSDLFDKLDNSLSEPAEKIRSYNWLFVFDRINLNCFACFDSFSKLVDFKKDKISALTLLPNHIQEDDIEKKFRKEMEERGINEFSYFKETYMDEAGAIVKKKINFEPEHFDFVVIYNSYNNSEVNRINYQKQNISNYLIINECLSNICIHNGI